MHPHSCHIVPNPARLGSSKHFTENPLLVKHFCTFTWRIELNGISSGPEVIHQIRKIPSKVQKNPLSTQILLVYCSHFNSHLNNAVVKLECSHWSIELWECGLKFEPQHMWLDCQICTQQPIHGLRLFKNEIVGKLENSISLLVFAIEKKLRN